MRLCCPFERLVLERFMFLVVETHLQRVAEPLAARFRSRASGSEFKPFPRLSHSPARAPELTGILRNGSSTG